MHAPCRPVESFDDELATLVADMAATMYAADGVGLAANQIGVDLAVFVFDCPDNGGREAGVLCNPSLNTERPGVERVLQVSDEGCLSLPGAFVDCPRSDWAEVSGLDHTGAAVSFAGQGLLARCLQHEFDHLQGVVFGDRLATRARKKLYKEAEKAAENYPVDWPAAQVTNR